MVLFCIILSYKNQQSLASISLSEYQGLNCLKYFMYRYITEFIRVKYFSIRIVHLRSITIVLNR